MATGEQYVRLAFNFALIISVSRLLSPTEVGTAVIGVGIMAIVLCLKEFATADFLIRQADIRPEDVRTSFTMLFLLTLAITAAMMVLAPWFGRFYGEESLTTFLRITAFAGLLEALCAPITGLLRRDMAFGTLAFINMASVAVNALVIRAIAEFCG
jgi:O-antigen/teichoic acid export membrane protein